MKRVSCKVAKALKEAGYPIEVKSIEEAITEAIQYIVEQYHETYILDKAGPEQVIIAGIKCLVDKDLIK